MLDYTRYRAIELLKIPRRAVLATSGPAGVQVGEFACEAIDLSLYLLVPQTSDILDNVRENGAVTLLTPAWELKGEAHIIDTPPPALGILQEAEAQWCALVCVHPRRMQMRRQGGWGNRETFDLDMAG